LFTIPIAIYSMLGTQEMWERMFCAICLVVTLAGVTLGASRGGFLGLVAGFLFVLWHSRERLRNLVVAGGLVIPLCLLLPVSPVQRFLHPNRGDKEGTDSRTAVWQAGLSMIGAHPIAGVGLGNFKPMVPKYSQIEMTPDLIAHNAYIEIAAEMGVPALLVFLGILGSSYHTLSRARRRASHAGSLFVWQASLSLQAGLLGSAVAIFFVSGQYQKLLWLVVFLSMCIPALLSQNSKLQPGREI
jgi:O-antigen ligase